MACFNFTADVTTILNYNQSCQKCLAFGVSINSSHSSTDSHRLPTAKTTHPLPVYDQDEEKEEENGDHDEEKCCRSYKQYQY